MRWVRDENDAAPFLLFLVIVLGYFVGKLQGWWA